MFWQQNTQLRTIISPYNIINSLSSQREDFGSPVLIYSYITKENSNTPPTSGRKHECSLPMPTILQPFIHIQYNYVGS